MQVNTIAQYQTQAGTPRTKPLGSCIIAIGFRLGILLTSTLQFPINRDQTRLRAPNHLVTTIIGQSLTLRAIYTTYTLRITQTDLGT